ncbi:MAG: Cyanophycin synthetase [Candidatus Moranbacteria bacterium GW2011_GWE2_35_2-]|nr:MAG: Cyanophycin synthetase [Candidatus Moranbacteria bacterium GW2011_GWE2_35_2-]KKQ05507.1 MAG: Cyanophycin synthetase [Candidatus Moranbacteria bacterium GW2011_GWF1_36_4]KKQ22641.1 MAG: Cyanophycin synthetase [Candidatus Moranbacteria bacterium GW2011_GWF2_37_11]KKQ29043.1 MAG: Cyanophycin synthetase [Candidatus Moranbacteria bacterium GW2011_GWD1_37_17]KKQ30421.1 MAG: Cyanophycin synthetase [Candidatus Moranbacteria bacterium GW2011_GWE1_37_24]KKQ47901.1 MAG: Cyanophycin synthetase [Ca
MELSIIKNLKKMGVDDFKKMGQGTSREILRYAIENKLDIYRVFDKKNIFIFKKESNYFWINRALTSKTNPIGVSIAKNKHLAKEFLKKLEYPVADGMIIYSEKELVDAIKKISFPVVVKPLGSAEGEGITININNKKLLVDSFKVAKKFDKKILIEKYIPGDYYRITYIADGSYAATKNLPAYITGNGKKTIRELIKTENKINKERQKGGRLKKISISEKTERLLASENYNLDSVLEEDKKIPLCFSGFDGGEYINVTNEIHPYFVKMGKDIVSTLGLPIVGIDIISPDIRKPLTENDGIIIEINGTFPSVQFHGNPTQGESIYLIPNLMNYLFS